MMLFKFSSRERALIIVTLAIVASTVLYGFIIEPLLSAYSELKGRVATDEKKLEKSKKLISRKDAIIAEYQKYEKLLVPLASDEEEIAYMLRMIEATARGCDIYIMNIRPQPPKDEPLYKSYALELSAEGEVEKLMKFIYDLQTSDNLLRVTRLTLNPSASKKNELKAVMIITKPALKPAK